MSVTPKSVTEENQLAITRQGGNPGEQGTWIQPKLALDVARWLNADFAVCCDEQIESLLHGEPLTVQPPVTTLDAVVGIVAVRRHQQTEIDTLKNGQRRQGLAIDQLTPLLKRCPPRPVRINDRQLAMDLAALPPPPIAGRSSGGTPARPCPHSRRAHGRRLADGRQVPVRATLVREERTH